MLGIYFQRSVEVASEGRHLHNSRKPRAFSHGPAASRGKQQKVGIGFPRVFEQDFSGQFFRFAIQAVFQLY